MKYGKEFSEAMGYPFVADAFERFPPAREIGPHELIGLMSSSQPYNAPADRGYRDGSIIRDLVYTLLKEWGWDAGIGQ